MSDKAPCGYEPGDCSAMGSGCNGCGNNPDLEEEEESMEYPEEPDYDEEGTYEPDPGDWLLSRIDDLD